MSYSHEDSEMNIVFYAERGIKAMIKKIGEVINDLDTYRHPNMRDRIDHIKVEDSDVTLLQGRTITPFLTDFTYLCIEIIVPTLDFMQGKCSDIFKYNIANVIKTSIRTIFSREPVDFWIQEYFSVWFNPSGQLLLISTRIHYIDISYPACSIELLFTQETQANTSMRAESDDEVFEEEECREQEEERKK